MIALHFEATRLNPRKFRLIRCVPLCFVHLATSPSETDSHNRLLDNGPRPDELVLVTGDVLRGQLESIDNDSVLFKTEQRQRLVVRESIAMITLDPKFSKRPTLPPHAILCLRDGHRLNVESLSVENDSAEFELFDGTVLTTASSIRPIEDETISFIQPLGRHIQYLSDLQPSSFKHIPYLSGEWRYGLDRDIHGRQLESSLTRRRALKGIAMHSTSRLTFELPKGYRTFAAELSLAHSQEHHGSVIYRVFLKGSSDWQEAYRSPIVRTLTPRVACQIPLEIDSDSASSISLVVDFADRADQGDHALWLDARLLR